MAQKTPEPVTGHDVNYTSIDSDTQAGNAYTITNGNYNNVDSSPAISGLLAPQDKNQTRMNFDYGIQSEAKR